MDHSSQDEVENVLGSHQPSSSDAGILLESNIEEGSLLVDYEGIVYTLSFCPACTFNLLFDLL